MAAIHAAHDHVRRGAPHPTAAPTDRVDRVGGVWQLAWPSITSFALQSAVGLVDMIFVASLGTEVVAGVGIGSQLHFVASSLLAAVTTGTVALVARSTGAGENADASRVLFASLLLAGGLGIVLVPGAFFTTSLVNVFGAAPGVVAVGASYLSILLLGSLPFALVVTLSSALRGAGDVRTPLLIGIFMNAVNVLGDYALIFGHFGAPALGADGSAIASVVSFTVGCVALFALWLGNALVLRRSRSGFRFDANLCRRILRVGVPTAGEQLAFNMGLFVFLWLVTAFGTEAVSAYMIGARVLAFSFIPGLGYSTAAATLVGQHLGAQRPDLAASAGWRAMVGAMTVMTTLGVGTMGLAVPIAGWFGAVGDRTAELTVAFIYILGAAQPLMAVEFAIAGALRGAGDTRSPLYALLAGLFVFRLGGAFVVLHLFDGTIIALWACLLADYAVKALILIARFGRGGWQDARI